MKYFTEITTLLHATRFEALEETLFALVPGFEDAFHKNYVKVFNTKIAELQKNSSLVEMLQELQEHLNEN